MHSSSAHAYSPPNSSIKTVRVSERIFFILRWRFVWTMAESEADTPSTPIEFESKYFEFDGVRLPPFCKGKMEEIANFSLRSSDIWIVTYPKSGKQARPHPLHGARYVSSFALCCSRERRFPRRCLSCGHHHPPQSHKLQVNVYIQSRVSLRRRAGGHARCPAVRWVGPLGAQVVRSASARRNGRMLLALRGILFFVVVPQQYGNTMSKENPQFTVKPNTLSSSR
ncbi:hypothetical protein Q8A73_022280 [Channa argus]|nr:hypothetical protein Q8A73_022280 [Channa argus]